MLLKLWNSGKPEEVSVIGLFMMMLVFLFRYLHLRLIQRRISTL
jgi:iron(III) transport system permease protein